MCQFWNVLKNWSNRAGQTSQIRPQLEAEGLLTPKLIGLPSPVGDQEILVESVVGLRSFVERKFIDLSRQIEELRQLFITITLKQELQGDLDSPWQPLSKELTTDSRQNQAEEITIGPNIGMPVVSPLSSPSLSHIATPAHLSNLASANTSDTSVSALSEIMPVSDKVESKGPPPTPMGLGEITDQNYLTVLGRALDLLAWTDEQADSYSSKNFGVAHWDELGRSEAERLINHLAEIYEGKIA